MNVDFKHNYNQNFFGAKADAKEKLKNTLVTWVSYEKCLKIVEENFSEFKNPEMPSATRSSFAEGLREKANFRKRQKESNFGIIHLFFHKIWQGCLGHGFQTKSDYGLQLANKLVKIEESIWKQELDNFIQGKKHATSFEELMHKINELDQAQFQEFFKIYLSSPERLIGRKLDIYKGLSPEKKVALKNFYARINWYLPVFNLIGNENKEFKEKFLSDTMIDRIRAHPEGFFQVWSIKKADPEFNKFVELILLRLYGRCKQKGDEHTINSFWFDKEFGYKVQNILKTVDDLWLSRQEPL